MDKSCKTCRFAIKNYVSVIGTIPYCCEDHWKCRPGAEASLYQPKKKIRDDFSQYAPFTAPVMEEVRVMLSITAKGARQLDTCLRMLYNEKIEFDVRVQKNAKGKIEYLVTASVDELTAKRLQERFEDLTR